MTGREEFALELGVSRETIACFDTYEKLLQKWNASINLVSKSTLHEVWTRHFLDSAMLYTIAKTHPGRWLDLGSGAGFPGLVLAILAQQDGLSVEVNCVEADIRKSEFLRTVSRELELNTGIFTRRVEEVPSQGATIVTARALKSLDQLLAFAAVHMGPGGRALFPKGTNWQEEVKVAQENWSFQMAAHANPTNPDGAILEIGDIESV